MIGSSGSSPGEEQAPLLVRKAGDLADLATYAERWRVMADAQPTAELFGTWEWAGSWLEAFSGGGSLATYFVVRAGSLCAAFPFLRERRSRLCGASLAFPGDLSALAPLSDPVAFRAFSRHLDDAMLRWRMVLPGCRADGATAKVLRECARAVGRSCIERPGTPTCVVDLGGGWDAYLASRSSRLRHEWRRKGRKLEGAGRVEFATFRAPDECSRALEAFFSVEARSWKGKAGSSLATGEQRVFHSLLARRAAERGWLRLHVLYLDSRPIAHVFGVRFRDRLVTLSSSFDPAESAWSPGTAVLLHALEAAAREGVSDVDFLGSGQRWKNEMATARVDRVSLCIHQGSDWRCAVCHAIEDDAKPLIRRQFPSLVAWKRARWSSPARARQGRADGEE